mgnify:CR=1 FL=1
MTDQENVDWIENYCFIMIAFAHMSDWRMPEAQLQVINEKLKLMLSQLKQDFSEEDVAQKLVKVLQRYQGLKDEEGKEMMDNLLGACESLKKELWFDELSATVLVQFLAEIAEADHKIEKTEVQLLNNLADVFGVKPPQI